MLRICFISAIFFSSPAFADQGCFKQTFVEKWAEKYSVSEIFAKEAIYTAGVPATLDAIYDRFIGRALEAGDARSTYEIFEVDWNLDSFHSKIPDFELVPLSLRPCVKWMWSK